jgi:L-fucose isomerase-like protein
MRPAKAGLVLLSAEWFLAVGLQGGGTPPQRELSALVEGDIQRIRRTLEPHFELIDPGPVVSLAQAEQAVRRFRAEQAELILLVHVMWSEDGPLVRLLRALPDLPLLVWCYNPYRRLPERMSTQELFRASGPVGFLQGSAPLSRLGNPFTYLFGHPEDPDFRSALADAARVFAVGSALRSLRLGTIGPRCGAMTGTYVEEFRLLTTLGVTLVPISAYRLAQVAGGLEASEVARFLSELKRRHRVEGVSERALSFAARASLAVGRLVELEKLGAVAIEDLDTELHRLLKTRPCLWVPGLTQRRVVIGAENDVISTLGLWLAGMLGQTTPMYAEIFTYDQEANCLLFGHAGMHDSALAGDNPITVIPDAEYQASDEVEGAWQHFTARPGPVTVSSLFAAGDRYRLFCFHGEVLPTEGKLAGFTHALVKIQTPLGRFFETAGRLGMTQHFALSYGDLAGRFEELCRVLNLEFATV